MTTIIYPFQDFYAADIAVKVQALAAGQNKKISVIPKHYGRLQNNVDKMLNDTELVLFLAHDVYNIDENTQYELEELIRQKKDVIAIIPYGMSEWFLPTYKDFFTIYPYNNLDTNSFINTINSVIQDIMERTKAKDNSNTIVGIAAIIALSLLLLGATKDD